MTNLKKSDTHRHARSLFLSLTVCVCGCVCVFVCVGEKEREGEHRTPASHINLRCCDHVAKHLQRARHNIQLDPI